MANDERLNPDELLTTVLRSGPRFVMLATNRLWDGSTVVAHKEVAQSQPESKFPPPPDQGRTELEAMLDDAVGDVVYGVAAAGDSFYIRTGTELICVRRAE